ncbi:MAG: carboxypeptidase-like regulatory domain-containing protein [Mediterranea sp.]|jgi:hypothetical protein|nr:carboxypeptidase-like regulatory domain-containing protein [Mediterranea sp.]
MKKMKGHLLAIWLLAGSPWAGSMAVLAQESSAGFVTVEGVVRDDDSNRRLENVNVSVRGTHIGTVTNAEGAFVLKMSEAEARAGLDVSHIGYFNRHVALTGKFPIKLNIRVKPYANLLKEVMVYGADNARGLVEKALEKVPLNYSDTREMLTAFYRETVRKRNRYISVSEAVMDILKTPYDRRSVAADKVWILKGRRLLSQRAADTLSVKVMGGPNVALYLDVVKNDNALLTPDELDYYEFSMAPAEMVADRPQYVVEFRPRVLLLYALFRGKIFIDASNLAFTRVEMSLDMSDRSKATSAMLQKKPFGLRFRPQEFSFLVTYKQVGDRTYLNYVRNTIRFRCDWKRRLFATGYTVVTEMVVTDRAEATPGNTPDTKPFGKRQVFYDKVSLYADPDFWGAYNIIEPTESLEHAAGKLRRAD